MADESELRAGFRTPPAAEYGNVPFWWWDGDELDEQRLTDQLETLKEQGVEAVCFEQKYPHGPPEGPQVAYFSEEWWGYMEHVVAECDRLDMALWIHDLTYHHSPPQWKRYWQNAVEEEIDDHPEFQGRVVDRIAETVEPGETATLDLPAEFEAESIAAYPVVGDGDGEEMTLDLDAAIDLAGELPDVDGDAARTLEWTAPPEDAEGASDRWHVAAVGTRPEGLCRTSRDVVDRIIERHYGAYVERLGDSLGDPIVGTFQDELYMLQGRVPCDDCLLARYRAEWSREPALIALFEDCGPGTAALRARYYDVVTTMIEENWFRPLYEWHERRGLQFAHDNWGRNDLTEHATEYGDYVRTMRWFQEPGYDDGGAFEGIGTRNFFDAKLAASIAACYDRDRVWGELLHTTGWGFPPDLHLAAIAENACYGLNRYNKHGLYYATLGGWYEHAPPDTHFRQPYWEMMDAFNDAVTRLMYLCSRGDPVVDVAMYYPIESVQCHRLAGGEPEVDGPGGHHRPELEPEAEEIDEGTRAVAEGLYRTVADLLLVDHETLVDSGVANGRLAFAGQEADVLLIGPATTVRGAVLEHAAELVADGGCVVSLGRLPTATVEGGAGATQGVLEELFGDAAADPDEPVPGVVEHEGGGVAVIADVDLGRGVESEESRIDEERWTKLADTLDRYVDRDVRVPADVLSTHRRTGDYDLYLLMNTRDEARTLEVDLRATGKPERWDVHDGTVEPLSEFDREGGYTSLELEFDPHGFRVIGFDAAEEPGACVADATLDSIEAVEAGPDGVRVEGLAREGGVHEVSVADGEEVRTAESEPVSVPKSIELEAWEFELEPTLDNEWGDARYPRGGVVGPEVREFVHRTEPPEEDGLEAGWHEPDASPERWGSVRWSSGQGFWCRPAGTAESEGSGRPNPEEDDSWEPYRFSELTGKPGTHPDDHGFNGVIGEEFLVAGEEPTRFWTTVRAGEGGTIACHHGNKIRSLEIDGEPIDVPVGSGTLEIDLPAGPTPVSLVVEAGSETHLAFETLPAEAPDLDLAHVPRLRWFQADGALSFDPRPETDDHVDWFRFEAPVGATALSLPIEGEARVWVDGEERLLEDGRIELDGALEEPTTVAVRSVHPTCYGGGRFTGPVEFETEAVTVEPGDWCDLGLAEYSGIGVYRTELPSLDHGEDDRLVLSLGDVGVAATVLIDGTEVGAAFSPPYEVELGSVEEDSTLEIRAANTIANHFATETPTRYVYDGQRRSGLFGPVSLRVERRIVLEADGEN
ncbi:glycosyl hydrolase [Saliphagus infecundisoli]|uniref:Glycosyl hydrolase n=1 Tax=Saliphagus infecundisoli TaxID=1849069 RepID=A0ABD5QDH3_9EURY|nr:glycosyl hydrolase [Saliphagus infecundisoli]